jgi:hypothetical protein
MRTRPPHWLIASTLIAILLVLFFVVPILEPYREMAFVCEYTGSRKGNRRWVGGMETGYWYKESAIEALMKQKFPDELRYRWTSYAGTGKSITGHNISYAHGRPGPILDVSLEQIDNYVATAPAAEVKRFFDTMQHGSREEKSAAVRRAYDSTLQW